MKIFAFLSFSFLIGCNDRPSREPFPGPQGRTTTEKSAEKSQEVLGGFDPDARFAEIEDNTKSSVRGVARIDTSLKAPENSLVYISARPSSGGPPLAVTRFKFSEAPFRFALNESNKMMADTVFEGMVELTIRIDQDGDPLSRTPGDLYGQTTVRVGAQAVELLINQKVE